MHLHYIMKCHMVHRSNLEIPSIPRESVLHPWYSSFPYEESQLVVDPFSSYNTRFRSKKATLLFFYCNFFIISFHLFPRSYLRKMISSGRMYSKRLLRTDAVRSYFWLKITLWMSPPLDSFVNDSSLLECF